MAAGSATLAPAPGPARSAAGLRYMPGLDGLRAIAVIAVMLYHADVPWWKGGFLGVDVFFVISGYLITSLLLADKQNFGGVRFGHFWGRRAKRLLPALFVLLGVVTVYAVLFVPDATARLRGDVPAAFLYYTNWWAIFSHQSYFVAMGRPPLLQHLWSLAVEEQFYLVWPLVFTAGMYVWRRERTRMAVAVLAAAVASTLLMAVLYTPFTDPSRVYYGTDTRATGILVGAALAFWWTPWRLAPKVTDNARWTLEAAGIVGLLGLFWFFHNVGEYDPGLYRGGFLGLSLVAAVVIAVLAHPAARLGPRVVGVQPLRWIGLRSYGIYLWHWPIFMVTRPHLDVPLTGLPLLVLRFGLTFGVAALSYRYVEQPIRHGALERHFAALRAARGERRNVLARRTALGGAACASVAAIMFFGLVGARPPAPPPGLEPSASASATAPPSPAPAPLSPGAVSPVAPVTAPRPAPPPVLAIGDSVMLGAKPALEAAIPGIVVNAAVSRHFGELPGIIASLRAQGLVGDEVVIHLGTNGLVSAGEIDASMRELAGVRRVVFLNLKVPRPWEATDDQVLADALAKYPNVILVDWHSLGGAHPDFFYGDGIHLRPPGAAFYAQLVKSAL